MPVTIKSVQMKYKDQYDNYVGVDAVSDFTTEQKLEAINTAGTTQTGAVNSAGETQLAAVNGAGSTQITNINNRAAEIENSWPSDYTDLTDDVEELKSALGSVEDNFIVGNRSKPVHPTLISGSYVKSTTGAITESDSYTRTDYLSIGNATKIKLPTNSGTINALCFYNSSKTFISPGIGNPADDQWHDVPNGAEYLIFSGANAAMPSQRIDFYVETYASEVQEQLDLKADSSLVSTKADKYAGFSESFVKTPTLLQNIDGVVRYNGNLVAFDECVDNAYIIVNSGNVAENQPSYYCTGFIPVNAGVRYKANRGRNHVWYDSNKSRISGASGTRIQTGTTAPDTAAYIRFTVNKSSDNSTNPSNLYFASVIDYTDETTIDGLNTHPWLYGKTINWIGDSIVDGPDFDEEVCTALSLTKLTTDGVDGGINGSTIALRYDGSDGRDALCIRYANMPDNADIIAVSCGTNDWMYAWCPVGDIESTENTTFYGALKNLCAGLIAKYPQKVILFTTPIKRAQAFENGNGGEYTADGVMTTPFSKNKYGKTLGDYADIIKEVCGYYSIPVLDMYRESLLNPHLTAQQDMFDNVYTHPNAVGQKIMARRVAGWLTQLGYLIS